LMTNYGKKTPKQKWKKQNIIEYATLNLRELPTKKRKYTVY
jgi:hypothetical protein